MIQSFQDEFELPEIEYKTPAAPNESLVEGPVLEEEMHKQCRKGVGKLIHLSKYSRPDLLNAVRELTRFGNKPSLAHYKAMLRVMKFCWQTKNEGLMIDSNKRWDGVNKNYLFDITGESDSTFASDPITKRSVSGWSAKLNNVSYTRKSKMQRFVTLSVTEAECVAATSCVRDMVYGKHFIGLASQTSNDIIYG